MAFRVVIIGGTGQVGATLVRAFLAEPSCAEIVMVNRKATALTATDRIRQVILNTATAAFPAAMTDVVRSMAALGDPVYGASCVGVGKGSNSWTEEEVKGLDVGVVGGFARGCHAGGVDQFALLSAVGSTSKSRIRYARVMGLKEEAVQRIGSSGWRSFAPESSAATRTHQATSRGSGVSFRGGSEQSSRTTLDARSRQKLATAQPPAASCTSRTRL